MNKTHYKFYSLKNLYANETSSLGLSTKIKLVQDL